MLLNRTRDTLLSAGADPRLVDRGASFRLAIGDGNRFATAADVILLAENDLCMYWTVVVADGH
jgi:hypothetical protein